MVTPDSQPLRLAYTARTAGAALSMSPDTIRRAMASGDLPSYRLTPTGTRYIRAEDLTAWRDTFRPAAVRRAQ